MVPSLSLFPGPDQGISLRVVEITWLAAFFQPSLRRKGWPGGFRFAR